MENKIEKLLTVKEVADWLGLKIDTVRNYCRGGELKFIKFGSNYRFRKEDVEAFLEKR